MAKPSRHRFGIQLDKRDTELLPARTTEVLWEHCWYMTSPSQASQPGKLAKSVKLLHRTLSSLLSLLRMLTFIYFEVQRGLCALQ